MTYNFDRMILQAEIDYRGEKLRRGRPVKRRNRHREPFVGNPEDINRRAR